MKGLLAGTSRTALAFVAANLRALVVASLLPFILVTVISLAYLLVFGADMQPADAQTPPAEELVRSVRSLAVNLVTLLIWLWLAVKVLRLYLLGEDPSIIGMGGTLRATGRMFLYHLGFLAALGALAFIGFIAAVAVLAATQSEALYQLALLAVVLAVAWFGVRVFVGFVPVAIGELPNFLSGWRLTDREHWALYARFTLAFAGVATVVVGVTAAWVSLVGDPLGQPGDEALPEGDVLTGQTIPLYLALQAASALINWYFMALFAEAYLRLSGRPAPLRAV